MQFNWDNKFKLKYCVADCVHGMDHIEMLDKHGEFYVLNKRRIDKMAMSIKQELLSRRRREEMVHINLRPWQKEVLDRVKSQDARQITFVIDRSSGTEGGKGKSTLADYMWATEHSVVFDGSESNMSVRKYYTGQKTVVFVYR